ncbi:MAG: hypothetical protein DI539_29515 [Flavobacterium psychrophilum]|nr:MAG: hypothetical protein DI539_29515 [Flavobacterium psychrophilum]
MRKEHKSTAHAVIESLMYELYPVIQHQFVLVALRHDMSTPENSPYNNKVIELVNCLKSEFQSLTNYENRLVFPVVLKREAQYSSNSDTPNFEDLQQLTRGKEQRILQLANDLSIALEKTDLNKTDDSITDLISLFKKDFATYKRKWNKTMTNLL